MVVAKLHYASYHPGLRAAMMAIPIACVLYEKLQGRRAPQWWINFLVGGPHGALNPKRGLKYQVFVFHK